MVEAENSKKGKMPDTSDMSDLQDVWQDTPPVDTERMARKARFVWWRMRINFVLEVMLSLTGLVVLATMADFGSMAAASFSIFASLYCIGGLWAAFRIRRGAWGDPGGDALSLVLLQIKRARSSILYVRLNSYFGYIGLFVIALAYWLLWDKHGTLSYERFAFVHWVFGGMTLFLIVFPFALRPFVRRKQAEIKKLVETAKQLEEA